MKRSPVRLGDYFVQRFQGNADFRCDELNRCGEPLLLCYLDSLVDTSESTRLREMIAAITAPTASWKPVDAEADLDDTALERALLTGRSQPCIAWQTSLSCPPLHVKPPT